MIAIRTIIQGMPDLAEQMDATDRRADGIDGIQDMSVPPEQTDSTGSTEEFMVDRLVEDPLPARPVDPEEIEEYASSEDGEKSAEETAEQGDEATGGPLVQPQTMEASEAALLESAPVDVPAAPDELPLNALLESLLFVAEEPVAPSTLAQALKRENAEVEAGLAALQAEYVELQRGLRVQYRDGKVQLVTNPAAAQAIEDFLNLDLTTRLSGPALEVLAIIAYRQPVTRAQVEAIRGVDCSGVLRKLQQLGLLEEVGRVDTIGRPILYGVTDLFMQHFGLTSLEELPDLPENDADALQAAMVLAMDESEDGRAVDESDGEVEDGGQGLTIQ